MMRFFNTLLDRLSDFFAPRKGLLPLIGLGCIVINLIIRLFFPGWLQQTDLFLHVGMIIAILGIMLSWAL
jgi:hypothetical protein